MRMIIGQCNNHECSQNDAGLCMLLSTIVHEMQYDHTEGKISCQWFANEQKEAEGCNHS